MKYEPRTIIEEAERSEDARETFLASMPEMVERSHGSAYRNDKTGKYNPDNHEHDFISHVLPQVAYANPRIGAKGRSGGTSKMIAKAMKFGLQRWVEDQKLNEVNQAVCLDGFFTFGVFMTIYEPAPWAEANDYEAVHLPIVRRLSPYQFLMDTLCPDYRYAAWLGHDNVWDLDDLRENAENPQSGWNPSLVALLGNGSEDAKWRDDKLRKGAPERNETVIREIWCPGYYLPGYENNPLYAGTIFTVAKGQEGMARDEWVREPRPYFGPPWGMYTMFGVYRVPGMPFPLGPLAVQKPCADGVNDLGRVIDDGIKDYKRQTFADAANPDLIQKAKGGKNGGLVAVKGFKKEDLQEVERGGITDQMMAAYQFRRSRLDRVSSTSETLRGNAAGSKTATAETIADQANETTVGYIRQRFQAAVTQVVDTAGWYAYNDSRFQVKLGEDAAAELGMQNPTFYGDPQGLMGAMMGLDGPAQIGSYRDVVEITIENNSMDMVTSAMQRQQGLEMLQVLTPLWQAMPAMPWVRWQDVMDWLADLYNNDQVAQFTRPEMLAAMQMMQGMPPQLAQGQPTPQLQLAGGGGQPQKKPTAANAGSGAGYTMQQRPMEGKTAGGYQNPVGAVA